MRFFCNLCDAGVFGSSTAAMATAEKECCCQTGAAASPLHRVDASERVTRSAGVVPINRTRPVCVCVWVCMRTPRWSVCVCGGGSYVPSTWCEVYDLASLPRCKVSSWCYIHFSTYCCESNDVTVVTSA